MILKGSNIDSGSIIGAQSVLSGKKIPHNTVYAGNPCKLVREGVFWDRTCVHKFTQAKTMQSEDYEIFKNNYPIDKDLGCPETWIYKKNKDTLEFDELEKNLQQRNCQQKMDYLIQIEETKTKDRFAHY